jgi:O-antigen ligase
VAVIERFAFNTGQRWIGSAPSLDSGAPSEHAAVSSIEPIAERPERRDWAFLFMMGFTAVVFLRPQDSIPGVHLLHLAELFAIGGLVALAAGRMGRGLSLTRLTPELVGVIALGAVMLITAPFSIWLGGSIGVFNDIYIKIILIYLLMVNVLSTPYRIERLTSLLVVATGYLASRAVLDYLRGVNLAGGERVRGAVGGIFSNPNDLALNMVALMPLAIFTMLRPGSTLKRATAAGCAVAMLGAIVASHSRGGFLGLVAMLGVLALFAIRRRPGFVIGGALAVAMALPALPASYWNRLASITDASKDETGSREARKIVFRESLQAFAQNPLTGVGAGQFKNWNPEGREEPWHESHDVLMQVAAELGIVGLALICYLIARAGLSVRQTRRLLRRARGGPPRGRRRTGTDRSSSPALVTPAEAEFLDAHSAAMAASIAGWFVCALFASVAYNWTFYYLLALAAAPRYILLDRLASRLRAARRMAA